LLLPSFVGTQFHHSAPRLKRCILIKNFITAQLHPSARYLEPRTTISKSSLSSSRRQSTMLVADSDSTPNKRHCITSDSDLIIVIKEVRPRYHGRNAICVHELEVSKEVMGRNQYFNRVSFSKSFGDTGKDYYEVKEDDPVALTIWLQLLHGCLDKPKMDAGIATVWNLLVVTQKYNFDGHCAELKEWFIAWYAENVTKPGTISNILCCELLYPCYYFDHAEGFAAITKHLAYNVCGHIEDQMPCGVDPMHRGHHGIKNNRVIGKAAYRILISTSTSLTLSLGSLNGARGSLRTKLHYRLYKPCLELLGDTTCKIKEKVFYQYHKALVETTAWPFEIEGYKHSINELIELLGNVKFEDPHLRTEERCEHPFACINGPKISIAVKDATTHVNDQFDGLCLGKNRMSRSLVVQLTRHRLHVLLGKQRRGQQVLGPPCRRQMARKVSRSAWRFIMVLLLLGPQGEDGQTSEEFAAHPHASLNPTSVCIIWCGPSDFAGKEHLLSKGLVDSRGFRSRLAFGC
jgi:hypothetical protein